MAFGSTSVDADFDRVLAQVEADVLLRDRGNKDFPFIRPDLLIVLCIACSERCCVLSEAAHLPPVLILCAVIMVTAMGPAGAIDPHRGTSAQLRRYARTMTKRIVLMAALALGVAGPILSNVALADVARRQDSVAVDRSGREQRGHAAVLGREAAGKRMADGGRFDPDDAVAASSTLPVGSTARITNLRTGRTAMVRVRDRIPGREGQVVNVSPKAAEFLGVREGGVFPVTVAPLAVPQVDGTIRLGAGTALNGRRAYVTSGRENR